MLSLPEFQIHIKKISIKNHDEMKDSFLKGQSFSFCSEVVSEGGLHTRQRETQTSQRADFSHFWGVHQQIRDTFSKVKIDW